MKYKLLQFSITCINHVRFCTLLHRNVLIICYAILFINDYIKCFDLHLLQNRVPRQSFLKKKE